MANEPGLGSWDLCVEVLGRDLASLALTGCSPDAPESAVGLLVSGHMARAGGLVKQERPKAHQSSWMCEHLAMWSASVWKVPWAPDSPQLLTLDPLSQLVLFGRRVHVKAAVEELTLTWQLH